VAILILNLFKSRRRLEAENLLLRHQLTVTLRRRPGGPRPSGLDRAILVWMVRLWPDLLETVQVVKPETVLRWHRAGCTTTSPTAEWVARQITEAFPWETAPRYLIRDQDGIYGTTVRRRLMAMGIRDRPTARGSPWQNGHAERLIGSIRRECLDYIVVLGEAHLRRTLQAYASYYNNLRTHRSLDKDAPRPRSVARIGRIMSQPILGGLHHQYARV
jgi:transposase InsO family protein